MNKLSFMTGLPRSGSTLLANILNSNPEFFCSSTSGLIDTFIGIKNNWKNNQLYQAEGIDKVKGKILTGMSSFLHGFYDNEFKQSQLVIDKSRGWQAYDSILDEVLPYDYKMIVCIRDVRAICASFEKLHRKNGIESDSFQGEDFTLSQSPEGRAEIWLRDSGLIGLPIARLRDAMRRNPNKFIIVPFYQLTNNPKQVLDNIHEQLGYEHYNYDFCNIKQTVVEEDIFHGWKNLHNIKSKIEPATSPAWEGIYHDSFLEKVCERYQDINKISV